jgi:hypothetical protein
MNIYYYTNKIMFFVFALSILFLNCSSENPSFQGKEYFIGTWKSDNCWFNKIEFSQPNARFFMNFRQCLSDTITNPDQYVDSCYLDYVQDSFLVNIWKSWDISQTEIGGTIIFYDTCYSSKASQVRSFEYEIISSNQFKLIEYYVEMPPLIILYTKQ